MKKLKRNVEIFEYKRKLVIITRLNNDNYGNPRYNVQIIELNKLQKDYMSDNALYYTTFNRISYNIRGEIIDIIEELYT